MSNFRWGIIGTGGIARAFATDIALLGNHEVTAVGSRTQASADEFARLYPGCLAYSSYEELVTADVDAVYVATPHPMHFDNTMLAMKAGKPVLCEKAFTINHGQAQALIDYSEENKIPLMEAMWSRFLPHFIAIKELVSAGAIGEVINISADHGQYLPPERALRLWEPELGGGALLDLGIYPLTLAHLILGQPASIVATATLTEQKVDLQTSMILMYETGAQAQLSCTMAARTKIGGVISGDKGRIEIDGSFYAPTSYRLISRDGDITEFPNTYIGGGLREEAREFERVVRNGEIESPIMSHQTTLELMRQMDLIRDQIGVRYPNE